MADQNSNNESYQDALRRQQEYARRRAAHAAQAAGGQASQANQATPRAAQRAAQARTQQAASRPQQQAAQARAQQATQQPTQQAAQQATQQAAQPAETYAQAQPLQKKGRGRVSHAKPQGSQKQAAQSTQQYGAANPVGAHSTFGSANMGASNVHGRDGYSQLVTKTQKKKGKGRIVARVLLIILAVVLIAGLAALAYGVWYMNTLSNNMAMSANDQQELNEVLTPVKNEQEPYYILLIGSDNWETYGERSDTLMLIRVDQADHKVTMVSVPRDTPYELDGKKVKINQAFSQNGPTGAVEAVQQLTGVNISYYAEIEFAGLANFVDSIGGIKVDVPYTIDYTVYTGDQDTVHIDAGEQTLNGTQAVALARMRTAYEGQSQDAVRQANVRAMTLALMNSVLDAPLTEIPGLIQNLSTCVSTSMDMNTMVSLATNFAQAGSKTIYTCSGPTAGDIDSETGLWLCYENTEGWQKIMAAVDSGEDPSSVADEVNADDQILQDVQ